MCADNPGAALQALSIPGVVNQTAATAALSRLGRQGLMPWAPPSENSPMQASYGYIDYASFCLMPVGHTGLEGLLKDFMKAGLTPQVSSVPRNHPFIFNSAARKKVSVSARCPLYQDCDQCAWQLAVITMLS
jgi:hypothetical protein